MRQGSRRLAVLAVTVVAALALAATPAYAHFCMKSGWNAVAVEKAAKSQAWMTADDWLGIISWAEGEGFICPAGADVLRADVTGRSADTLFMGPGLLAGGTLHNGKGKTPAHFSYIDFEAAFAACD